MRYNKKKPVRALLFDLDGTLLRVDMSRFIPSYVEGLAQYSGAYAKPKKFIRAKLGSIRNLLKTSGDGIMSNEARITSYLQAELDMPEQALVEMFQRYAAERLEELREFVRPIPLAKKILQDCRQLNLPLVLATNPVFPEFMIRARLRWAGLDDIPFDYLTSTENSCYCKPESEYFHEISNYLQVKPENCLMIGNDAHQDMAATAIGMQTFLVDTWLIETEGAQWPYHGRGDHNALQHFLSQRLAGE
ncbi:HAD family hydrolase [Malonomonas rubra]|nr:HAD family hydrolase [Malonomonas rubra]